MMESASVAKEGFRDELETAYGVENIFRSSNWKDL